MVSLTISVLQTALLTVLVYALYKFGQADVLDVYLLIWTRFFSNK